MYHETLADNDIIRGFREGDAGIIRKYFYGYCRVAYNIFDQRYQLHEKENLDFMSLSHQYALYLMEHDWRPLEDHAPGVSLRTWFVNGFRYVVLDALKWHRKEYGSITFEDYLTSFDMSGDLRTQFARMVEDVCDHAPLNRQERLIINMLLLQGFKSKEIAAEMGMSPSAISQKYMKLKEQIIVPYFKKHFDMDLDMPEVMDERRVLQRESLACELWTPMPVSAAPEEMAEADYGGADFIMEEYMERRTTPEFITELQPNEVFVFGSNLKGMHGGGAAYVAYRKFGAVMGQGVGMQGQSYAIPTMQGGVETIRPYVDDFIRYAREHPEQTFLVTRIGCGIAGFTDEEISPLFEKAHGVDNIVLPPKW